MVTDPAPCTFCGRLTDGHTGQGEMIHRDCWRLRHGIISFAAWFEGVVRDTLKVIDESPRQSDNGGQPFYKRGQTSLEVEVHFSTKEVKLHYGHTTSFFC